MLLIFLHYLVALVDDVRRVGDLVLCLKLVYELTAVNLERHGWHQVEEVFHRVVRFHYAWKEWFNLLDKSLGFLSVVVG